MPLQDYMGIVSVDDHLIEHGRVWTDRLPNKYKKDGPTLVVDDDGAEYWRFEGSSEAAYPSAGTAAGLINGQETYDRNVIPRSSDLIPGVMDPIARVKDMDSDGVAAQMCFPTYPRFAGTRFLRAKDKDLALRCIQAYNDFVIEEWCGSAPTRYIPLCIVPLWDVSLAVDELQRVAEKGARSISFPELTAPLGLPSIHTGYWDPFFAVTSDVQLPLSMHIGTSGQVPRPSPESPDSVYISLFATNSMMTCADYIFSNAFHKFKKLKIALSEGGVGWVPHLKERLDYVWERQRQWDRINRDVRPSELFDEHVFGCFIDDEVGISLRNKVGVRNMMLESDFPHSDTSWPNTRKRAEEVLAKVSDEDAYLISERNARQLYNFNP